MAIQLFLAILVISIVSMIAAVLLEDFFLEAPQSVRVAGSKGQRKGFRTTDE